MVSPREAWVADKLRKLLTLALSAAGTWFLLHVLYRFATGTGRLDDPALFAFLGLALLAVLWIRATRRVPRGAGGPPPGNEDGPPGPPPR